VALNKRKTLDAAQKYLQKGNLDKALKEYQKVVDADPKDANVRLKVGDVQLRKGNSQAAIDAYLDVAKQFMKDGFDAKAVALFKQITKIDEKRYDIYEPLAELYQRLGLTSDAMSALQIAAEAHQREGRKKEGLALLRKMASLDPSNTGTRLKIAEMLWKEELQEEALAEYDEVVAELGRQDDHEGVARVHEQVLRHLPERLENLIGLGTAHLELGDAAKAEAPLLKATEVDVESVEAWEAVARCHEAMGRRKEFEDAWKTVAAIHKDRGNEERSKEILQLYVTGAGMTEEGEASFDEELGGVTLGELGSDPASELDLGAPESAPAATPAATPATDDEDDDVEIELDDEVVEEAPAAAEPDPRETSLLGGPGGDESTEADPSQLLAEAGVYLRYSQHDKAVHCLERILEVEPGHLEALEKLGEARLALGDEAAAVALWKEGADYARQAGNQETFDLLCERIRDLDEGAAEGLAAEALAPELGKEGSDEVDPDLDLELAFDTPSGEPELTGEVSSYDLEIDMEPGPDVAVDEEPSLEFGDGLPPTEDVAGSEPGAAEERVAEASSPSQDLSARFDVPAGGVRIDGSESGEIPAEDLEEAEFYYRQGLLDEAEQILKRLLQIAPGHPQVLLRLGEIAKSRGESPSQPVDAVDAEVDFDKTEDETQPGADTASDATLEDLEGKPLEGEPQAGPDEATVQVDPDEIDVAFDDDEEDEEIGAATAPSLSEQEVAVAAAVEDDDDEGFDLAAELEDEFDDANASVAEPDDAGGTTQAGFQAIFQSFKAGVKETLGEGEYETHYDLGIAYREMGLLDDAIGEFAAALPSPTRKLDCLAMMGLCAIDLGRARDAISHLEQALAMPRLEEDRMAGLRFDLGRAYALLSEWDRTRELWRQVAEFDPGFQDVARKLEELGEESSPSLGVLEPVASPESGEALESFDDLIAEAEADDDDDPDDGPDGSGPGDGGATQWGRKISYG
jgi:tetratricopeptide (TPR) repeat protein